MIRAFRKIYNTGDDLLNRVQDNIAAVFAGLSQDKFLNRERITVTLATGSNTVLHNLGYTPTGYIIVSRTTADTVYDAGFSETSLILVASGALTIILEVW